MSTLLKLKAETETDLDVFSSTVQDAILKVGDISYNTKNRTLSLRLSRFAHEKSKAERRLAGLSFGSVLGVQARGIDRSDPEAMMVLLSLSFTKTRPKPSGVLTCIFAGGGEIKAQVECIDGILADISAGRETDKIPLHPMDETS